MPRLLSRLLFALPCLAFAAGAFAQKTAKDIPVEDFFKREQHGDAKFSPNGERLAALVPLKGRNNLVVIDVAKRTRNVLTSYENYDVGEFYWINNDRLCIRVADGQDVSGEARYRGTYCANQDGTDLRDFTKLGVKNPSFGGFVNIQPLAFPYDGTPELYVSVNMRARHTTDVYRFNTATGKADLVSFDSPGWVSRWILDRNYVPRIAVSIPDADNRPDKKALLRQQVWYRDGEGAKWEKLWEYETYFGAEYKGEYVDPIAFDFDNSTLYVASNAGGRDKAAVFKYDTRARKMGELVFEHPLVDVRGGLVFSRVDRKLLGIAYSAEKPSVKWLDPEMDRLQKQLDATFPGTINALVMPALSKKTALVFAYSDVDPGTYHLLDRTKPSLETLVRTRPWLDPALMSERRFIRYKARDGLEIPAWVTIPKGSSGKNLPLIVNVHGGPWVRAYGGVAWGRWPEAQFFASRGYVVLEPEPRGSTGFGHKHFASSFKQWGQAMQDDINDGALHLVKEGLVDRNRMCIHGGSYGGYAAAVGVTRDPDLWRCGTPFVAVTDLFLFQNVQWSDIAAQSEFFETDFKRLVGDTEADKAMFTRYSPTKQAANVKAPVFLSMGSSDVRVPLIHGEDFNKALLAAGKKVEFVVYNGEGHGYNKDENVADFYRRLEKFFGENLK